MTIKAFMTRVTRRFRFRDRLPNHRMPFRLAASFIAVCAVAFAVPLSASAEENQSVVPMEVKNLSNATGIAAGGLFGLAVREDGKVMSWGYNAHGALGDGNETSTTEPVQVKNLSEATAVAAGEAGFGLALLKDGKVMAWGNNAFGALGDGNRTDATEPVEVKNLSEVTAIAAGAYFSLALLKNGKVMAWGRNHFGQLGDGSQTDATEPVEVKNLGEVTAIAAGEQTSFALLKNGKVMAWGINSSGELGDGTNEGPERCSNVPFEPEPCSRTPVEVKNLSEAAAIAAGGMDGLAVLKNGKAVAWGENNYGQLGDGTLAHSTTEPVEVKNLSEATAVASGATFSLALLKDGKAMAWGLNFDAQLGDGNEKNTTEPVQVKNLSNATGIAAGAGGFGLALLKNGKVMAWGQNAFGELGDGNAPTGRPTIKQVSPHKGLETGGTLVTITGTNLTGAETVVDFGSNRAIIKSISPTSITVESPAGPEGATVHVTVTTDRGTSYESSADLFSYGDRYASPYLPRVTGVSPGEGPQDGGTTVTITGYNLHEVRAVHFGTNKAASFTESQTGTSITAVAPPGVGTTNVSVTTPEGASPHVGEDKFTYFPPPSSSSPPTISGKAEVGQTLTEQPGTWTQHPFSYNYQWLQCNALGESCLEIQNATGRTYVPQLTDVGHKLKVEERAFNGGWSSWAASLATEVVLP